MPDYSAQVKPADRWAIAAYIRALQRSQRATEADLQAAAAAKGPAVTEAKEKSETMSYPQPAREGGKQ
jgi:hypothetical protein